MLPRYVKVIELPSCGYIYSNEWSCGRLFIERLRLGDSLNLCSMTDMELVIELLNSKIVKPKGADLRALDYRDRTYVVASYRAYIYGSILSMKEMPCGHCNEMVEFEIDLNSILDTSISLDRNYLEQLVLEFKGKFPEGQKPSRQSIANFIQTLDFGVEPIYIVECPICEGRNKMRVSDLPVEMFHSTLSEDNLSDFKEAWDSYIHMLYIFGRKGFNTEDMLNLYDLEATAIWKKVVAEIEHEKEQMDKHEQEMKAQRSRIRRK